MLRCTVSAVLPIIALRCSPPPLPGEMPVSYLKDAEQTEPWTLPLARALLIDILTIWNGFYGYLLYFKCMFALVSKQVCECNRVWLAGGHGLKDDFRDRLIWFPVLLVGGSITRETLSCVTSGCLFKTSVMTVPSLQLLPSGWIQPSAYDAQIDCCS